MQKLPISSYLFLNSKLKEFGRFIETNIPNINRGGCAVYAALLGKHLKQQCVDVEAFVAGAPWFPVNTNIDNVRARLGNVNSVCEWERNGIYFHHVGLTYKKLGVRWFHDTTATKILTGQNLKFDGLPVYEGFMTIEECDSIAFDPDADWNTDFKRRHIPRLQKYVNDLVI